MGDATAERVSVLVVEDDFLSQELVSTALEEAGYAANVKKSGSEAIAFLESDGLSSIKAVITDIDLGTGPTGWDVAKRARELHPNMPVVYTTGRSQNEWAANGVPQSILISKPFAPAQIITAISQLLNATQLPPENGA